MATLIKVDHTSTPIDVPLTLEHMQKLVGGYVEFVTIGGSPERRELLIVDEEGLLKRKPVNVEATLLYQGTPPRHQGVIVGDAIRCVCTNMGQESEAYS